MPLACGVGHNSQLERATGPLFGDQGRFLGGQGRLLSGGGGLPVVMNSEMMFLLFMNSEMLF